MTTKNLIPRADGEGGIGIDGAAWASGVFNTGIFVDSVGIGTTTPIGKLSIEGSTASNYSTHIVFNNTEASKDFAIGAGIHGSTNQGFGIVDRNTNDPFLYIADNGNVGIGITNSSSKITALDTVDSSFGNITPSASDSIICIANNPTTEAANNHASLQLNLNAGVHNHIGSISLVSESATLRRGALAFCTDNGTNRPEAMRINSSGNVGIGTTEPASILELASDASPEIIFSDSTAGDRGSIDFQDGDFRFWSNYTDPGAVAGFATNNFTISKAGDVGIGTLTPGHNLHISGSNPGFKLEGSQPRIWLKEDDETDLNSLIRLRNSKLQIDTVADDDQLLHNRITILNTNGNVGIGTDDPFRNLTLAGNFRIQKTSVDGGNVGLDFNVGGGADEPELNIYDVNGNPGVFTIKDTNVGIGTDNPGAKLDIDGAIHLSGVSITPDEEGRVIFSEDGIMVGQAAVKPDPDNPESLYFQAIPQVKDTEGNAVTVLTADKLGLGTSAVLESSDQDLQFKLLTDENRFVVGTSGNAENTIASGWYRFNDFQVKGATDIGAHPINPVDTRIYSDESSFILFKTDLNGNRVAHLVGGDEAVSPNNAIALGIAVKVDSSESPQDIEFVHTDGESYSVVNGNSDSVGTNGLPIRQGFQPSSVGANPAPLLIDGGSF